jgi:hypothetical protein
MDINTFITYQHLEDIQDDKMDKELVPGTAMTIMVSATSVVLRQISKLKWVGIQSVLTRKV